MDKSAYIGRYIPSGTDGKTVFLEIFVEGDKTSLTISDHSKPLVVLGDFDEFTALIKKLRTAALKTANL